jgi:major vault protein
MENRPQKIPVPRRSFLWSINESSGEVITHVGPTEFTPSANDRIVRASDRSGIEQAPQLEARPFIVVKDGEYVVLSNPPRGECTDEMPNGAFVPGANKEKELLLGGTKIIPGPCGFPLWPGQSAEVRQAHKLGGNHYLLVEVVGAVEERSRYTRLVTEAAGLSSAVIDAGANEAQDSSAEAARTISTPKQLILGQRIVIQGRHTPLFIPPTGVEVVPPLEEMESGSKDQEGAGVAALPVSVQQECTRLVAQVQAGLSAKQFSVLKNELRHRPDLSSGEKAILLTALDAAFEERGVKLQPRGRDRGESRNKPPADPYARRAVVLGPKEFCVLFDADGNARIVRGPARVFPGPYDTFLQRGSRRRIYDAYEMAEHQALWIRLISPISRERLAQHLPAGFPLDRDHYPPGHEFIVRGRPTVFFPFNEAEVISPVTSEPHVGNDHDTVILNAIGIDQKSGIYVRDLRTGIVKTIRGEVSHLVDPRFEEHVHRRVPRDLWNLMISHAEPHKAAAQSDAFVTTPWALSVSIPNNEAVMVTSHHQRRVEVGPKAVLLDYDEQLVPLRLSKGPSKDGSSTLPTCFLRHQGTRTSDTFDVESNDLVRFRIRVGFKGHFEGEPLTWFQIEDPVKLLADTARAKVREAARAETANRLLKDFPQVVRGALLANGSGLRFPENGMVIDAVDVLSVQVLDTELAQLFAAAQQDVVKLQISEEMAVRRLTSKRHIEDISAQETSLKAEEIKRRTQLGILEAEGSHAVDLRSAQLDAERAAAALDRKQGQDRKILDFQLASSRSSVEAEAQRKLQAAEAEAKATDLRNLAVERNRAQLAKIEADLGRAIAEADAVKLQAIQRELVGALHAASDSEVMKIAAANMNLVALLGGKSPAEILGQILRGTPLSRTVEDMRERTRNEDEG